MSFEIIYKTKHKKETWECEDTDRLRAKHCMCFRCAKFGKCWLYRIAWFTVIKPFGLTFMVTRCRYFIDSEIQKFIEEN